MPIVATTITIHALKVLARGRLLKDKQGKPMLDEEGNLRFTPSNRIALDLLRYGRCDTTGILDDLIQSVSLAIWEAIAEGKAIITCAYSDTRQRVIEKAFVTYDIATRRAVYNVVQNALHSNVQKHFSRQYIPVIDEDGTEDAVLVTQAMRQYQIDIDCIAWEDMLADLRASLTEREEAVLEAMYTAKQVERAYRPGGGRGYRTVTRPLTIAEIAGDTGLTPKQARGAVEKIRAKLSAIADDAGIGGPMREPRKAKWR